MTTIVPVQAANLLYINGGQVSYVGNTSLSIAAIQCRDSTNIFDIAIGGLFSSTVTATTLDFTVNGLNGLDTGAIDANKFYFIYAIASQAGALPSGFIASLSASVPLMPFGYGVYRLIGMWNTDASSHLLKADVIGTGSERTHVYDADISVLSGGTSASLALISLDGVVPAISNTLVTIDVDFTPATASDKASFTDGTSTATLLPHVSGSVAAKVNSGQLQVLTKIVSSVSKIQYINSAASGSTSAWVHAFRYYL